MSKLPEAVRVDEFLDTMTPAVVLDVRNGRPLIRQQSFGSRLIIMISRNNLQKINHDAETNLDELIAWYEPEIKSIFLISDPGLSSMDVALQLLHEGEHAVYGARHPKSSRLEREIAACDLELHVLESIGGKTYATARKQMILKLKAQDREAIQKYDQRLDRVFGKTDSLRVQGERQKMLMIAAGWYAAEMHPKLEHRVKVFIIRKLYHY